MLRSIREAIEWASWTCEQCGSRDGRRELVSVEVKNPNATSFSREKWRTRRLCPKCAEAVRPQPDPARSLQVLEDVPTGGDTRDRQELESYREALALRRTPVAMVPDLERLTATLNREFPWFRSLTHRIARRLVARQAGNGWFKLRPLLLHGPPGAGKTSYLQCLAELSGNVTRMLPLAGSNSSMLLKGNARGWATSRPGAAIELIKESGIANPLIVLDEIDKVGSSSYNGNVHQVLIQLLEPRTARRYFDGFLETEVDLSWISWVATANEYRCLPGPLLNRFDAVEVGMPGRSDYPAIVETSRAQYARECGIRPEMMPELGPAEWAWLQGHYQSPRHVRKATETLLGAMLADPGLAGERVH